MMKNIKSFTLLLLMLSSIFSTAFAQGLILSAPPRETPEEGMKMYGPIAQHLSKLLGVSVTYKHPGNWMRYQREMRNDKYDIIFDGPHFISWREEHLGHKAIIKLPGKLQFVLVTDKVNDKFKKSKDLIGKNICGISPPNLSTLSVLDHYRNPVRQPVIKGIKGGMGKVYKSLAKRDKKRCDAAVLRTAFYNKKLSAEQRAKVKTLFKSKAMPNQGVSVSRRISPELRLRIQTSLTIGEGISSTNKLLKRFGGKAKNFIPVKEKEYAGYNNLLEGVIFGW
jgi:ABC-type phosphate/phosphonate transport system substrate-binding protein